ncbi:diguanylate cyclase (GGDEF) domain-containing protein [Butyrivibrio fibrisolvens DSM 3071]|uniref:Diguanylate cyclase (GGDEF) domain-containing protein n=1 Tax=Butyrivibrio fibrisolvens DSM 3071 TaxID=1121131 RepID=A0A1M5ZGH7_BUTFI|nr:diguanylate cyclase [Butyrivibrio fibrisolvens]SHI23385.1 diguanylate cyclase (GGDEF) domain-containing protein [Butyrivibrio fibrisolvens DSM 3071]
MNILKKIKNVLFPERNEEIYNLFDHSNMASLRVMSLLTVAIESVSLIHLLFHNVDYLNFDLTVIILTAIIVINLITAISTDLFLKKRIKGHNIAVIIAVFTITAMTCFAMFVSYMNYIAGRQIIIFYAVTVCLISFIHITPLFQLIFILVEHSIFYAILYNYDGAKGVIVPNVIIYMLIILVASQISFYRVLNFASSTYTAKVMAEEFALKSSQDQLTGLMNRYALDNIPNIENPVRCQIAMSDIDHFKVFNEKYGHIKGDEVLKATASALLDVFRKKDCYRYGGDEFLIVAINLTEDTFRDRLALWEKKLSVTRIENIDEPVKVNFGVASGIIHNKEEIFKLIKEADEKLNTIKSMRNHSS